MPRPFFLVAAPHQHSAERLYDELVAMFLLQRFGKKGDWLNADERTRATYREHARLLREYTRDRMPEALVGRETDHYFDVFKK